MEKRMLASVFLICFWVNHMWLFTYKKYNTSKPASVLSIVGLILRFAGLITLCGWNLPVAAICIMLGCACHYLAEHIHFRAWVQVVQRDGLEDRVKCGDLATAGQLYKIFPSKKTVRYLTAVNPEVGKKLSEIIEQVKAEDKK